MASLVQCPRCQRRYALREEMLGRKVVCASCGEKFRAPAQATAPAVQPSPGSPSPPALPTPAPSGADDLLGEALGDALSGDPLSGLALQTGDPLGGEALGAGTPLAAGLSSYRSRRMSAADSVCLVVGGVLAAVSLGCLLVLFQLLRVSATAAIVAVALLGAAGAGLIVFAQRRNLLVALPVGTGIACLLCVGIVIRPLAQTPEQLADECLRASEEFVAALESIHDEATLRQARPKALAAMTRMLQLAERAKRLETGGQAADPETEQKMKAALSEMSSRGASAGRGLGDIPGGRELIQDMMRVMQDAQKRIAAVPNPPTPSTRRPQDVASGQRGDLQDGVSSDQRKELASLGLAFHHYHTQHRDAPRDWDAFEQFLQTRGMDMALTALSKLRQQGWVFHGGVGLSRCRVGTSNFLLFHPKDAAERGGPVLYMDGAVTWMSAEETRKRLADQAPLEP